MAGRWIGPEPTALASRPPAVGPSNHGRSVARTEPPANGQADRAFTTEDLRTFALAGHRGCGKTSLSETLLQAGRVVREVGAVEHGTTLLDHGPESRAHHQTMELSTAW